jgi:hypothetical protein
MITIAGKSREEFLALYNKILKKGLSDGICDSKGRVCIEAAVCIATGDTPISAYKSLRGNGYEDKYDAEYELSDRPTCVDVGVASFKVGLNDVAWSSPQARAKGLYDLGIAQLGTKSRKNFGERFINAIHKTFSQAASQYLTEDQMRDYRVNRSSSYDLADIADNLDRAGIRRHRLEKDFFKRLLASTAVNVLRKLNAPGVKWLDVVKNVK